LAPAPVLELCAFANGRCISLSSGGWKCGFTHLDSTAAIQIPWPLRVGTALMLPFFSRGERSLPAPPQLRSNLNFTGSPMREKKALPIILVVAAVSIPRVASCEVDAVELARPVGVSTRGPVSPPQLHFLGRSPATRSKIGPGLISEGPVFGTERPDAHPAVSRKRGPSGPRAWRSSSGVARVLAPPDVSDERTHGRRHHPVEAIGPFVASLEPSVSRQPTSHSKSARASTYLSFRPAELRHP